MSLVQVKNIFWRCLKNVAFFLVLWGVVLAVNFPVISFDMMYFEQPVLYLVNQKITSLHDLLNVYLHPMMLDVLSIPFFRPSGHFLVYQVITLFLDWHNTRGFLVVNFFFLALACCMIIKVYRLLFPRYVVGGYIACGIYLMHPALMLSRLSPMHFEFASVFFFLVGLYYFILFCQKNSLGLNNVHQQKLQHHALLLLSILSYFIATTFKEVTIILGPIVVMYLLISLYNKQKFSAYFCMLYRHREMAGLIVLYGVVSITIALYFMLMWPTLTHPLQNHGIIAAMPTVLNKLLKTVFALPSTVFTGASFDVKSLLWEVVIFPPLVQKACWLLDSLLLVSGCLLYIKHSQSTVDRTYKKSFLFLGVAAVLSLILPVTWSHAMPWHLALSLVFVSMAMGFCVEYVCCRLMPNSMWVTVVGSIVALALGLMTITVMNANIQFIKQTKAFFALQLDRNAVLHPPAIKSQLNADSVLVVEDSSVHSDYHLGDSIYPVELYGSVDIHRLLPVRGFYEFPFVYGGTLFRWAYLMPALQEQVYPFQVEQMQTVSDTILYLWLQHDKNIFCLGYDKKAEWVDRTTAFKKNLLLEKIRRHLTVNRYYTTPASVSNNANVIAKMKTVVNVESCEFVCDKTQQCKGFIYEPKLNGLFASCYFYGIERKEGVNKACQSCHNFIKTQAIV